MQIEGYSLQRSIVTSTPLLELIRIVCLDVMNLSLEGVSLNALCEYIFVSVHEFLQTCIKLFNCLILCDLS